MMITLERIRRYNDNSNGDDGDDDDRKEDEDDGGDDDDDDDTDERCPRAVFMSVCVWLDLFLLCHTDNNKQYGGATSEKRKPRRRPDDREGPTKRAAASRSP